MVQDVKISKKMTIKRDGRITHKNRQFLTIGNVSCYVSIIELYRDLPYPSHQKAISCQLGWHRMEFRKLKMQYLYLFFVLTLFVITSCIPRHEGPEPKSVPKAPVISPEPPYTISKTRKVTREDRTRARQYVLIGIALLQKGEEEKAKKKLFMALHLDPNNKRAKKFLKQINTDPETYLGREYSHYTVQYGESLSIIAKNFLGDSLEFYILARYNAIKNPDLLKSGQIIKIPKKTRVPRVTPQVREEPQKEAPKVSLPVPVPLEKVPEKKVVRKKEPQSFEVEYTAANQLYKAGKYQGAIDLLQGSVEKGAGGVKVRNLLALIYSEYALDLIRQEKLLDAQKLLQNAVALRPDDKRLKERLANLENKLAVQRLYKNGLAALKAGSPDKAQGAFIQVVEIEPDHAKAQEQLTKLRPALIDFYNKKAILAYRRQHLKEAISTWDKVLELDPDHELARLNRARALELQEKLEKFKTPK